MSYSFSVRAATAMRLKEKASIEMHKIVEAQPVHANDRRVVELCVSQVVDTLRVEDPAKEHFALSVSGHCVSQETAPTHVRLTSVGVSISVGLVKPDEKSDTQPARGE